MKKNLTNRREFIKFSALTSAGVGLLASPNILAEALLQNKMQQVLDARKLNYSIQTVALNSSSSTDFNGDNIDRPHEILWDIDGYVKTKGGWPQVDRKEKVVVVGGGMSGLLSAYLLKEHKPLLLEQDNKFGGNSKGEIYNKSAYSIGAAYITVPDENSTIEKVLKDLNIFDKAKLEEEKDVKFFYKNEFLKGFWQGSTDPKRADEFIAVANEIKRIYENEYPDIPFNPEGAVSFAQWKEWDQISFQDWLLQKWPNLHPHILEFFQLYGWSSFNGSIDELSTTQMLNFITSESVGILAFPAGNSLITFQLQKTLEAHQCPVEPSAFVIQVKTTANGVIVTYENSAGQLKAIECERCIVAAPKFVASKIVPEITDERNRQIAKISYRGYIVANVILNKKIQSEGFDVFMMTGVMPEAPAALSPPVKGFSDVCFGSWAQNDAVDESVLTLYRPLPYDGARQFLFSPMAYDKTKAQIAPDLDLFLKQLGLSNADVKGIRLTRWGHSLPIAQVGLLTNGLLDAISAPINERIYFANQDNFANPAFETAFAAAEIAAAAISKKLS
ncbi:MAG: NAD(P)-binding protein [Bdellovibrio sp.]|nr:NAD(P)-binding protein [Bdellovibrio sp.]